MNYLAYLFLSRLVHVEEKSMFMDGMEQPCLIIPTKTNQIKRGKRGDWLIILRLAECAANAKQQTHDIQLMYIGEKDLQKSYDANYHKRTARLGRVYEHDRTPSKKIDRTNNANDCVYEGSIILSDIPANFISWNKVNNKRYIANLQFEPLGNKDAIYTGFLCLGDIPDKYILTLESTGKKYINTFFCKLDKLDTYMNTHHLIIKGEYGSEIEIGRFKEWRKNEASAPPVDEIRETIHNTPVNQRPPVSIDGIKF